MIDAKLGLLLSWRMYDLLVNLMFRVKDVYTDKWRAVEYYPGTRAIKPPCHKTLFKHCNQLLHRTGQTYSYEQLGNIAVLPVKQALDTCLEVNLGELAMQAERERVQTDGPSLDFAPPPPLAVPETVVIAINIDKTAHGITGTTTMALRAPEIDSSSAHGQSTKSLFPVAIMGQPDSHEGISTHLQDTVDELVALDGQKVGVQVPGSRMGVLTFITIILCLAGDLCMMNSVQGISTCASLFPCLWCLITKAHLGNLVKNWREPFPERTLEDQNGWSHTRAGEVCTACGDGHGKTVTQDMVDVVKKYSPAMIKQHRDSHFGTVPGRRPLFQIPATRWIGCCLHMMLRMYVIYTCIDKLFSSNF